MAKHKTNTKALRVWAALIALAIAVDLLPALPVYAVSSWSPTLLVNTEAFQTVDSGDGTVAIELRFGTSTQFIKFLTTSEFQFSHSISVLGNMSGTSLHVDRDATFGAGVTASGTIRGVGNIRAQGTLSGNALNVNQQGHFGGALFATGAIQTQADLTINGDNGATDAVLTFGHTVAATLTHQNTRLRFQLSKTISVLGSISGSSLNVDRNATIGGGLTASGTIRGIGTISGVTLNANSLLTGATIQGFGLYGCTGTANKLTYNSTTKKFLCEADQAGGTTGGTTGGGGNWSNTGSLESYLNSKYVNVSGDTMTGGLTVRMTTSDVVKTTSGTTLATDFSIAGSTLLNLDSSNDSLTITDGVIPASGQGEVVSSSTATTAAVGAGAFTILRSDGKVVVVHGNAATSGSLWDGVSGTMTSMTPGNAAIGAGAIGLLRTDGRWLIVNGGAATSSSVFDPYAITAVAAGPTLTSCTATTGTNAFLIGSGSYIIMCGGSANWGIYQPSAATAAGYTAGTALPTGTFGAGAHAIQRDDGSFLVFLGGNTSTHYIYYPATVGASSAGNWSVVNPISGAPTITTGAFSIRRADGKFLVIGGAQNASSVYNSTPTTASYGGTFTSQSGAGYGPTAALGDGAGAVWRPDGRYFLVVGGGVTTTNIIDPSKTDSSQFIAGPALTTAAGAGSHMLITNSGSVRIFAGAASTTTMQYKMGYILGGPSTSTGSIYESECITTAALSSGSTLNWNASSDDYLTFQVRTGKDSCPAGVTGYKTISSNGDLVRPTFNDNRVQFKVIFKRSIARFADQEWGLRRGLSQTRYRRVNKDPTLFDVAVRNTTGLHRTQFEFGESADPSGPLAVNIVNDKKKNLQIQLANTVGYTSTYNTASSGGDNYNGAFIRHNPLATAAGIGTVVMKRPDSKFVIISGTAAANAQLYNQDAQTFTLMSVNPGFSTGTGALAFKRPDGKFLIVGGVGRRNTSIYDPIANTFTAGPSTTQPVGEGAFPIPLPNGRVLIAHGGFRKDTSIYDPYQNIFLTGSVVPNAVGRGATTIPRPDGRWLVTPGTTTATCTLNTATLIFDPYAQWFYPNTGVTHTTGVGPGSYAVQLSADRWLIPHGGGTAATCAAAARTSIYSTTQNRIGAGFTTATATRFGAFAMPRPDGSVLMVSGGGATTTFIHRERAGTFIVDSGIGDVVAGPTLITAVGTGALAFQRDDGKYVVLSAVTTAGSPTGTTTVQLYDAGWVANGYYRSENMYVPDLSSYSTLSWKATPSYNGISASVRTGTSALALQVAPNRPIQSPGMRINPRTSSEKWMQAEFSLKRTFPSYGGIWEDVWYNGGTYVTMPLRTIENPTITEFSVGQDQDLVNLQADRLSVFRVSSNGDIFSGTKGSINTGGADLAERYTSEDDLLPGELVSIDYLSPHGVLRSKVPYQEDLLGVVSSNPGFVAGAFTEKSHPVALVGRVPVWTSLENGPIRVGDRLTSSATPGLAMKATKAGRVIGIALTSTDLATVVPCPRDEKKSCIQTMMFVNLSDWRGP